MGDGLALAFAQLLSSNPLLNVFSCAHPSASYAGISLGGITEWMLSTLRLQCPPCSSNLRP